MGLKTRHVEEKIMVGLTGVATAISSLLLIVIIGLIFIKALPALNWNFITTSEHQDGGITTGISNAIFGTFLLASLSVLVATPFGVATAVYLGKYARENSITNFIKFCIDALSGTPAIVAGIFGLLFLVIYLKPITGGYSLLSASIAMTLLILPVIIRSTEEAIATVPMYLEEASYALGASRWHTVSKIVIPFSISGIITGVVLAVGRAAEESAVVILTGGYTQFMPDFGIGHNPKLLFGVQIYPLQDLVAVLPVSVYNSYEFGQYVPVANGFAAAFVLIVIVMLINTSARLILWWFKTGYTHSIRRIKLPFITKAITLILGTGTTNNETKFGKFINWLTTDPKKNVKEKDDFNILAETQETGSVSIDRERLVTKENTIVDSGQPDKQEKKESSIYSLEATNKAIETIVKSETIMSEPLSYPPENKHRPAVMEPAAEIGGENENVEPELYVNKPLEQPSLNEIEETLKSDAEDDRIGKFVKWLTTDPKKEAVKKKEQTMVAIDTHTAPPELQHQAVQQPVLPVTPTPVENVSNPVATQRKSSGLEIIPPTAMLRDKKKSAVNPNLVVYPNWLPPVMNEPVEVLEPGNKKDEGKSGGLVKWLLTDPKKEAAKEKESVVLKAEAQPVPVATPVSSQEQTSRQETVVSPLATDPLIMDAEAEQNVVVYTTQSPPSMEEISETLGPKGKKGGKAGGLVKWLTTDPKKETAKVKSTETPRTAAGKGIDNLYATDGSSVKAKTSKIPVKFPNIFGGGSSKQKNGNEMPEFNVGKLAQPSLEGSIKDTDFTYAIGPPYQYVRVFFDGEELVYNVLEPVLDDTQKRFMSTIERGLEKLISSKIVAIKSEEREQFLREKFDEIIDMYGWNLSEAYRDRMFYFLRKRYLGYDKIDIIMKDHFIEDISCNGPNAYVYIFHRIYGSVRTNVSYGDVELNKFVMRMAQISGRHISILQPIKDISLPDGSRANLTLGTEVTKKGATFTIRKFKDRPISPIELMEYSSIDARALAYLWTLLDYKRSILVSGGTASGKTTLMNVLCSFIRPELKIVSLEDTPELNLVHPNWIQSVTRSGFGAESGGGTESVSGVSGISAKSPGNIGLYDLLVAALRQRPEYIIVGEVRGAEAFTLFQAIAVGHAAMGTIHAGNMRELLSRVESNPMNVPRTLFAAMDVVCFSAMVRRGDRNVRRVMQIVEILELDTEGNLITNPVFRWDAVSDRFIFTGKSHIFDKIESQLGIRQEALIKEMDSRAAFLQKLRQGGIRDYTTVVENIREYELNKLTSNQTS